VVSLLYFIIAQPYRWVLLLGASAYFYMYFIPIYILILLGTILIDYAAGLGLEKIRTQYWRKVLLIISIITNIGILAFFKYYNFFIENINLVLHGYLNTSPLPFLEIILPVGLSFHTFQALSYTIEVYRGNQAAEKHLGIYALYVLFYPQLVAGPIERPQNVLHQFRETHTFDYQRVTDGLKLMAWGLFKKVVIADRLAIIVDTVYAAPNNYDGIVLITASLFFAFQIYCDFSGYSDIALGSAKVMGYRLMLNFNSPYLSASVSEFWKRWHISLSTWFRDYLYISLGGNRVQWWRWYFNLWFVFLVSGFWHGARWTFVIWGALHGAYLIAGLLRDKRLPNWKNWVQTKPWLHFLAVSGTFGLVAVAWVFFRAKTLADAWYVLSHLHVGVFNKLSQLSEYAAGDFFAKFFLAHDYFSAWDWYASFGLIGFLFLTDKLNYHNHATQETPLIARVNRLAWLPRWGIYYLLVFSILFLGKYESVQFIYFQF
jgi:D-alanyl-lipoteichoic acid acyltransferase DltB (MBOAT superfamily)